MQGTRAMLTQRRQMLRRPVTFVSRKAVDGIKSVSLRHLVIARDFGDDRRGGDTGAERVALDNGALRRAGEAGNRKAVYEGEGGTKVSAERPQGDAHRFPGWPGGY